MTNERDEILMSQFVDGELPSDWANELLLDVLDAPAEREKLKALLRLRQATAGWRTSQPPKPLLIVADRPKAFRHSRLAWRMGGLAVAACVGGLLVLSGVWAAGWMGRPVQLGGQGRFAQGPAVPLPAQVTPEQQQQVAKVFALHESVAGPLAWYAADDQNVRLASAREAEASRPIAVLLRLESEAPGSVLSAGPGQAVRTLVIVCREDAPAVIRLPAEVAGQASLRVYLVPKTANGKVQMHYAIAADGDARQGVLASLTGQRRLGLAETSLGQLAMGNHILNVEAAAWPMRQERN